MCIAICDDENNLMKTEKCSICPRKCNADRNLREGFCKVPWEPVVASVMAHRGEEQVISGSRGSGTVFFNGCNLGCVFCQNYDISQQCYGDIVSVDELSEILMKLEREGVHNINLVTPSHFTDSIAEAIILAKGKGIKIPFVYNSNGYDSIESLQLMEGLIDIYMPDFKYANNTNGFRYSGVSDYFTVVKQALREMYRQVGGVVINGGIMQKGVLIRHLVMPGLTEDSFAVLNWIKANLPDVLINLMDQYRPAYRADDFKGINRRLLPSEFYTVEKHFRQLGLRSDDD